MSVTDLTGTGWTFNNVVNGIPTSSETIYSINFRYVSYGTPFFFDELCVGWGGISYINNGSYSGVYDNSYGWSGENEKTIYITGGTDATNAELISFIQANATKIYPVYIPGNVYVNDTYLSDIADAIRAKNGLSETYKPMEMAAAIDKINLVGDLTVDMIATRDFGSAVSGNGSFIASYTFYRCSSLSTISFPNCTTISNFAFAYCSNIKIADFSKCTLIGDDAFGSCYSLSVASFPECTNLTNRTFQSCLSLTSAYFPKCTVMQWYTFLRCYSLVVADFPNCSSINYCAFQHCSALTTANIPVCTTIGSYAFSNCYNLLSVYLNEVSSVTTLNSNVFYNTPIGGRTTSTGGVYGSVFVPSSLYNSFITATNWASISARIVSM